MRIFILSIEMRIGMAQRLDNRVTGLFEVHAPEKALH